jgi:hypothetical protein
LVALDKRLAGGRWKASAVSRPLVRSGLVLVALVLVACIPDGLAFVKDERLEIVAPDSLTTVTTPVTIDWEIEDFRITGPDGSSSDDAGYFGVFVDRAPIPPGEALSWLARDDRRCLETEGCPDRTYFADRDAYTTSETSFTLRHLPDQDAYQGHERHEVTVVLLDGTGRRIGESAWYVDFLYEREE